MDTAVGCGREAFVFFLTRARERIKTALEKIASNIYKKNKKRRKKMVLSTKKKETTSIVVFWWWRNICIVVVHRIKKKPN